MRFPRFRYGRSLLLLCVLVLVPVVAAVAAWRVQTWQQRADEARQHLQAAREVLAEAVAQPVGETDSAGGLAHMPATGDSTARFVSACNDVASAHGALQDVGGQLDMVLPLVGAIEALPGIGTRARSQASAFEAGRHLASAGVSLCQGLEPLSALLAPPQESGQGGSAAEVLRSLAASRPALLDAAARLERLDSSLMGVSDSELDESSRRSIATLRERLPAVRRTLKESAALLDLLGGEGTRRYLVLSQNIDELRATGGFTGTAGVVEVSRGEVRLAEYGSSRVFDTPPHLRVVPPPQVAPYLGATYWHLAAANWWPSFPDVARQVEYFYGLSRPDQPLDGVIALDQVGLARVLEALGPVEVPEYDETVTADTLQAKLVLHIHDYERGEFERKQFAAALTAAVIERVMHATRAELPNLIRSMRTALDEQHLLVWVEPPEAARVFARKRWDGRLLKSDGDALLLVDSEVMASKHSQEVVRDAEYRVDLTGQGNVTARLTVNYTNQSRPSDQPGVRFVPEYRTFLRAYVPAGAALRSADGFEGAVDTGADCGRTVFGGDVLIPAGTSVQVVLEYTLPRSVVVGGAYSLLLQQQPGAPPGTLKAFVTGADGTTVGANAANGAGRHQYWVLGNESDGFTSRPLPEPALEDCGRDLVRATPIAAPVHLEVPRVGIAADIVDLGVTPEGVMEAPEQPDIVAWYRTSARAGQPGNSVMSGHVDWGQNTAVFWGLRELQPGDTIRVRGEDGVTHQYAVEWNRSYPLNSAPVEDIVAGSRDALLTLITCDGIYDKERKDYSHRRVVRAKLIES